VEAYSLGPEHRVLHIIEHPPKRMELKNGDSGKGNVGPAGRGNFLYGRHLLY